MPSRHQHQLGTIALESLGQSSRTGDQGVDEARDRGIGPRPDPEQLRALEAGGDDPVEEPVVLARRQLDDALADSRASIDRIVLDLSAVEFMDTSSLAVIVGHWKGLVAAGGWLALAGARFQYTRTLWITGLADRIPMYDTVDAAIAAQQAAEEAS